jgi:hypothetical protein
LTYQFALPPFIFRMTPADCCFHHRKRIKSWGSMGSSNLLSNFQVDCYLFQKIPSLPRR